MDERIKVAGPGCDTKPSHRVGVASYSHVLVWGAEMAPDGIVYAALYEYRGRVTIGGDVDPSAWEPAIYAAIRAGEAAKMPDCACRSGRICAKHGDDYARSWWFEAKRRRAEGVSRG